ncbi:cubilin [Lepeophtheirus salmonis]|uniref:cubilin n=1 Tax=Lepeophtheirus salmonis TaxID=72036 RepID=UPI001AE837C1|nr:cubilin-like [Lepeophtheirus salmonis]
MLQLYKNTLIIILVSKLGLSETEIHHENPKIVITDGHLLITTGKAKNITFKTSENGFVRWNRGNAQTIPFGGGSSGYTYSNGAHSSSIEDRVHELESLLRGSVEDRIVSLENSVQRLQNDDEGGASTPGSGQVPQMRTQIRQLQRLMRSMREIMNRDHCANAPCRNGGKCINTFQGPVCQCSDNWEGNTCEDDINECIRFTGTDLGCQNGATCQNLPGTYRCHCAPKWYGIHCTQRNDDCSSGTNEEICGHGTCIDQPGGSKGHTCICKQGWKTDGVNPACVVDVNECNGPISPCSKDPLVQCINTPGSFSCQSCPSGFSGNGFYCQDINECLNNNGGCSRSPSVDCINTRGSFRCGECPIGYQGNGQTCAFMGPCHINNGGCSPMAVCLVSSGIVQCFCRPGYNGMGIGPMGCLPGASQYPNLPGPSGGGESTPALSPCMSSPCQHDSVCIPMANGFICNCAPGYTGSTCSIEINECDSNPCFNGATCIDMNNDFRCVCNEGFKGSNCEEEVESCGGTYQNEEGSIVFPPSQGDLYNHELDCTFDIQTVFSKVLNITFHSINIEDSFNCEFDYVDFQSDESRSKSTSIGRFCGETLPKPFTSVHHYVIMTFHSDHSVNGQGFSMSWTSIDPVCGGVIRDETHGSIYSPGYPNNYPHGRNCTWTIFANPSKRVQFHFATIEIERHPNCSFDYVQIRDGMELTINSHILAKYCNSTSPPPITSSGSTVSIDFVSDYGSNDRGFHITWSEVPGIPGCGGIFTSDAGQISSPGHPETYESHLECDYLIRAPNNVRLKLEFLDMGIENGWDCSFDFVEVRDGGNEDAPLIGRYCGTSIPSDIQSLSNQLFVRFKSDHSMEYEGFRAQFETVCGGIFNAPTGIIMSPYHPNPYPHNKICDYLIAQPIKSSIHVEFIDFDIENGHDCRYDYLEFRDGDNSNSTLIETFCGDSSFIPPPIYSTHNYLWFRFATDSSLNNRGFKLNYTTEDNICGGIFKESQGIISSPKDTEHYPHGLDCKWIIKGEPGSVIRITWVQFVLEIDDSCFFDYVEIYDDIANSGSNRYCGEILPPTITSVAEQLTIHFVTDSSISHEGFIASYSIMNGSRVCGGDYYTEVGFIRSPGWPENYIHGANCEWTITVPQGQQILLNITNFQLEPHEDCIMDYLEIRNGGYMTSPLIGKYCSNRIPPVVLSSGHQLYIKFLSDFSLSAKGFEIFWDGTSTGCGGHLTAVEGSITSPGYPMSYHENAECFWNIRVSEGSKIQIVFTDLDLEPTTNCRFDYVKIIDSSSIQKNSLGQFCSAKPNIILSSGNMVRIKFRSDISYSNRGFRLHYTSICDNELTDFSGIIESPNFPSSYPHSKDCHWTIKAPRGNQIQITFSYFRMGSSHSNDDSLASICSLRQLNVTSLNEQNQGSNSKSYCGNTVPTQYNSTTNTISLKFKSDGSQSHYGFRLQYNVIGCGGSFSGRSSGLILTPGYPHTFSKSIDCVWKIATDLGTRIELNILDLDLKSSESCNHEFLRVYGGPDESSPMLTEQCTRRTSPMIVQSMGNHMLIIFRGDNSELGKLMKAFFKTKINGCGGKISAPNGQIHSPNYPNSYDKEDDCFWSIETDPGHAIRLSFTDFDIMPTLNCSEGYVSIYDGDSVLSPLILRHCNQSVPTPLNNFVSSGNKMYIRLKAGGSVSAKGFIANYSRICGGHRIIRDGESGELISTNFPHPWAEPGNCSWILEGASEMDRITLTFLHMDIFDQSVPNDAPNGINCSNTRIEVRDGGSRDSPLVGQYCSSITPPSITSHGNKLFVFITKVNYLPEGFGFRAVYSKENSACGGEITSGRGRISSPDFPNPYPIKVECIWTVGGWPGNQINFQITYLDIEESDGCNKDYLELHENGPHGRLLGHHCGSNVLQNFTVSNKLWIKFNSDSSETGNGFIAQFSLAKQNEIMNQSSGQISSPLYPYNYRSYEDDSITWRIVVEEGNKIEFSFDHLDISIKGNDYCLSYLLIKDGYDAEADNIFASCGVWRPGRFTSTGNVAFIYFHVNAADQRRGSQFLLSWSEVPGETFARLTPFSNNSCTYKLMINDITRINNTNYPTYDNNENCTWILETLPDKRIKLLITELSMESTRHCSYDAVTIYDGMYGTQEWNRTGRFCKRGQIGRVLYSTGSYMKIQFKTDSSRTRQGFVVMASSVCGGYSRLREGIIQSPRYPESYPRDLDCTWRIHVRPGRTIQVEFEDIDILSSDSSCPDNDYLTLRNGESNLSPLILINNNQGNSQNGRICGSTLPSKFNTSSNHLSISFKSSDSRVRRGNGFKLLYRELSISCGEFIHLSSHMKETILTSPNYPNVPQAHSECYWKIVTVPGKRIQLDFLESFDVKPSRGCNSAGVQLFDGLSEDATELGTFCRNKPSTIFSTGYMLYVRYYTFHDSPNNGFKARVKIATCGGTHYIGRRRSDFLTISSPDYPHHYKNNLACDWTIIGPSMHFLEVSFIELDLPSTSNCSDTDHLTIIDHERSFEAMSLGTFCGRGPQPPIESLGNNITIKFKSDQLNTERKGFLLRVKASFSHCGETVSGTSGIIKSVGYPNGDTHFRRCSYLINAPEGHKITFQFEDFDLNNNCHLTFIGAYSQFEEYDIPIFGDHDRHTLCQRNPPSSDTTFKSLTNKLLIDFQTYSMIGRRGFKMAWTSEATTECGGEMGSSGVMSPILDPVSGNYTLPQLCTWKHVSDQENMTISYKSSNIQIRRFNNSLCMGDILIFDSAPSMTQDNSFQFCEPRSIEFFTSERLSRFTFIAAKSLELPQITNKGFNMSYRIHPCGGVISSLNGPQIITSPNYGSMDSHYSSGIDCVWKLHFEEGEQVALDFNSFDLQNSGQNCDNSDYLEIVNGPSNVKHPLLWKGCGVQLPDRRLISMRNYLWIHFHSNEDSITGRGFSISATPLQNGCGGIFHGFRGTFSIPSSGESKYEREMECIWDIKGTPGYQVSINFTDRFEVELTSGCTKDYLQIQYWNEDSSNWIQSGELICGRELPASILIPYHHVRLVFRSDNDVQGDGFSIRWELLCGGHYKEKKGEIASPGYPNNYHSNTHCNYYINASINDYVVINFQEPFELEEDPQCRYDSLSIYKVLSSNLIGKFCKHSPYPISTQGPVLIQFDTDYVIERAGFKLSYEIHSCGGNITQDGVEIASPLSPQTYRSNSNCTWFIKAPENQVVELKFNLLDLEASGDCFYDKVGIFDGHTLNATHELAKLCGNQSGIPIIKSNQNEMTVQFVSDNSFSAAGFKAMVRFTYGASSGCGGMINMTSLQSKLIKSVDANGDGNYEMDLNCQWTIFTGNDKILKLHFNAFDIENEENATFNKCWDFLKVFDGPGQFSSLIGEFCGNVIPSTTIQSSGNFMWINFFSDSTNVRGGFEALITVEDPICGSHTVMNATKEVQILTSPGYPNNYQSNLRCRWVIYGGSNDTQQTVHLNFLEFNIQSDSNCRQDRVHISDLNGLVSSSHGFNTSIIHSADRSYYLNYRWLSNAQIQDTDLCGSEVPRDFFSMGPMVQIEFISNHEGSSKGFKLEYSLTSCNRTYDKSYGLLLSPNFPNVLQKNVFCDFNVTTVPSKTISVYFRVFSIPSSQNCSKSYLEVYDGLSLSSSTILRTCGYSIPIAIHSSGPSLRFKTVNTQYPSSGYEATYLTTDQGPGCGGRVMDSRGVVTSPNYPRDHSQDTDCTWTLSVPPGRRISLRLSLRFGYDLPCADNYLEVFDRDLSTNRRQLVSKYCGGDNPSVHEGPFNTVDLHYVTSANNTGGWKAHFQYVMN